MIPAPVSLTPGEGEFTVLPTTSIINADETAPDRAARGDVAAVGDYLAEVLHAATGLLVRRAATESGDGDITLALEDGHDVEGYRLSVSPQGIHITAGTARGLFFGVQSLRQLLPTEPGADCTIAATVIVDHPRFAYRGAMLDVARHFFSVDDVKRYLDAIALLKLNVLHLHLTDDQGWRLHIDGWPRLTEHGGRTQVGGGGGGFYTQDDYREIVEYAESRFITIVPEVDLPGHTNAALASYPELTCDGRAPELYEGIEVGFSSLCIDKERTYEFVADVLSQVAALTPGPWLHIGGDEALSTPEADYLRFIERASAIAADTGKTVMGWHEMGRSTALPRGTIGQYWNFIEPEGDAEALSRRFVKGGGQLIMAPGDVAYLDMKYDESSPLGLVWAKGPTSLEEAYSWDPALIFPGIEDAHILGVEAPLWTETITTISDAEYMAFPRITAIAEIAWSPRREKDFPEFISRLTHFNDHLDALGINRRREEPRRERTV